MPESNAYIAIQNLSHRYASASENALDGVSLTIARGTTFGLLGPNGAGKSTLLSILTGIIRPQTGSITIAGHDLATDSQVIKSLSALVPQEYAFYPSLTGRENLHFFADVYRLNNSQRSERLKQCVDACLLNEIIDKRAEHYSGGLKRRLNLAIGMLAAPQLLYLDEPTVGIDATSRACILDAIAALKKTGTTIIYTSHYMEEVETLCDEIAVIDHGKVIVREHLDELLRAAAHRTLHVTLKQTLPENARQQLSRWSPEYKNEMECLLIVESVEIPVVVEILNREHADIDRLQYGVSRLNDVYMRLLENQA